MADSISGNPVPIVLVKQGSTQDLSQTGSQPEPVSHKPPPTVRKDIEQQVDHLHDRKLSKELNEGLDKRRGQNSGVKLSGNRELEAPLLGHGIPQSAGNQPGRWTRMKDAFLGMIGQRNLDQGRIASFRVKNG